MKVKEYVFEITTTKEVKVKIPEVFLNQELIDDWESGLWTLEGDTLEEKVQSIAQYAAEMEAARSKHLDRSSFILEAAYKAAEETILDQRLIFLGDEDFNNLNRDLSVESLETNKCLQKFLNQEPNWQ